MQSTGCNRSCCSPAKVTRICQTGANTALSAASCCAGPIFRTYCPSTFGRTVISPRSGSSSSPSLPNGRIVGRWCGLPLNRFLIVSRDEVSHRSRPRRGQAAARRRSRRELSSRWAKGLGPFVLSRHHDRDSRATLYQGRASNGPGKRSSLLPYGDRASERPADAIKALFRRCWRGTRRANYQAGYLCRTIGNTLYYSAELLHYEAINGFTGGGGQPGSLETLVGDIQRLVSHFNTFIFGFAALFLRRHLNRQLNDMRDRKTALEGVPHFNDLKLPYFTELPSPARPKSR